MTKSIEVSGKTEDEAVESALVQLGLTRDEVSVEIIEQAKSGFLGFKSTPAVVRVSYESTSEPPDESPKESLRESSKESSKAPSKESINESSSDTKEERLDRADRANRVEAFIKGLLERMDVEAAMEISQGNGSIDVTLTGKEPGALIGRRGETLDAIQHLTNYVINRGGSGRTRINVDAENYRQRRNETLEALAVRIAGKVMKYRKNMTLEPMNAYERHVIHSALQDYANITTYSVGSEPNRRIVVAYSRNNEIGGKQESSQQYREWR